MKKTLITLAALAAALTASADGGYRWLRYGGTCANAKDLERAKAFVDRAAAAGMDGMTVCGLDNLWRWSEPAKACLRELKAHADAKGVRLVPHGWSVGYGTMTGVSSDLIETTPFRVTRDADLDIREDVDDLLLEVEKSLEKRRKGAAVRLEIAKSCSKETRKTLQKELELDELDIYTIDGPLGGAFFSSFANVRTMTCTGELSIVS